MCRAVQILPCVLNVINYFEYMVSSGRIVSLFGHNAGSGGRAV